MHKRNKCFEIDALKDTWGKPNGTFSWICEYYLKKNNFEKNNPCNIFFKHRWIYPAKIKIIQLNLIEFNITKWNIEIGLLSIY